MSENMYLVASTIPWKNVAIRDGQDILTFRPKEVFFPGGVEEQPEPVMRAIMEFEYHHRGGSYAVVQKDTLREIERATDLVVLGSIAGIMKKNADKPVGKVGKSVREAVEIMKDGEEKEGRILDTGRD